MHFRQLAGIRVMVTRPIHQAQALCDMITAQGGQAISFPVLAIEPVPLAQSAEKWLEQPDAIDYAVFISANAVEYGLARLLAHGGIPDKLKLVSIGKASADKIQQLIGRAPDIFPTEQYNSEALLALDSMQAEAVNNKRVIIFRGCGGRELLATTLQQRGAKVHYAEVYRRIKPTPDNDTLRRIAAADAPDIITVTSNESLNNLLDMLAEHLDETKLERIMQTPLVVVNEKMRDNARSKGFKNAIIIAARASNDALLQSIQQWLEREAARQ